MENLPQTAAQLMSRTLNNPDTPANVTKIVNAGLRLWQERPDEVDALQVFEGYAPGPKPQFRTLTKDVWIEEWHHETAFPPLLRGHTYRVYATYRRWNGTSRRVFQGVKVIDANALVGISGIKVGEVAL